MFLDDWWPVYHSIRYSIWVLSLRFDQVQEKKIKKISSMNVDASKAVGNGCIASSSSSTPHLPNGGSCDGLYNHPSNDLLGAISSLRLQVVISWVLLVWTEEFHILSFDSLLNLLYNFPNDER